MKYIFLLFVIFMSACTNTSHFTLYSDRYDIDREHFTVDTRKRGNIKMGEVNSKLLLFYFPLTKDTLNPNKLAKGIKSAFGNSPSKLFVDTEFKYSFGGAIYPLCIYCQTDVAVRGYEAENNNALKDK